MSIEQQARQILAAILCVPEQDARFVADGIFDFDRAIQTITKALTQSDARNAALGWQPIETAPKGEEDYVLAMRVGAKFPFVASYDDDLGWLTFNGALESAGAKFEPTHWMPLPESPLIERPTDD